MKKKYSIPHKYGKKCQATYETKQFFLLDVDAVVFLLFLLRSSILYSTIGTGIFIYLWAMNAKCSTKKKNDDNNNNSYGIWR